MAPTPKRPKPHLERPEFFPLKPAEAKPLFQEIVEMGEVTFCAHAREEMKKDRLDPSDFINVVRAGIVQAPDHQNNE